MAISAATTIGSAILPSGTTAQLSIAVPTAGVPVGSTIIVCTMSGASAVTSVVDSVGNTYTKDGGYYIPGTYVSVTFYRSSNCFGLTSGQSITASIPLSTPTSTFAFTAEWYANLTPTTPFDTGVATGDFSGAALASPGTGSVAGGEELVFGFGSWVTTGGAGITVTPGTGYALSSTTQMSDGSYGLFSESKVMNPATTGTTTTATLSRTASWSQICALYKGVTAGGGGGGVGGGPPVTGPFGPIMPTVGSHGLIHPHRTRKN